MRIRFRDSSEGDLDFVIEAEGHPENNPFVTQWEPGRHREALKNDDMRHLIIEEIEENRPIGYLIIAGLKNPNSSLELMRIVITEKGRGYGREALEMAKTMAFEELGFHRLWLDVREKNSRAKLLYESCGFEVEGKLREAVLVNGDYESLYLLSILEADYKSAQPELL